MECFVVLKRIRGHGGRLSLFFSLHGDTCLIQKWPDVSWQHGVDVLKCCNHVMAFIHRQF
jgi:hypothetical protein